MHPMKFLLIAVLFSTAAARSEAGAVQIPADLVSQLFEQQSPNHAIPKRPFQLDELLAVLQKYGTTEKAAVDLTRRYLKITHPAGTVPVDEVVRSQLPDEVKRTLLSASPGSVVFADTLSMGDWLSDSATAILRAVASAPAGLVVRNPAPLVMEDILAINEQRFSRAIFYDTQVPIHAENGYHLVSYPRRQTHMLDGYLEWGKATPLAVSAIIARCQDDTCYSQPVGVSVGSLGFTDGGALYPQAGQRVAARCRYETAYRREYESRVEIEFAFDSCTLETVNGNPPQRDPLMEDLRKVKGP